MSTLPTYTKSIDDKFVNTWYEIRPDAIDNIIDAHVVWAKLRSVGSFVSQSGSEIITRTIQYGIGTGEWVDDSDTLPDSIPEIDTMAHWDWKYLTSSVRRDAFKDQQNAGKFRIVSYVSRRLMAAKEGLDASLETQTLRAFSSDENADKQMAGLNHLVPPYASRATGTFGRIARSNSWWQAKYKQWTSPMEVNMIDDMTNLYNSVFNNQEAPDFILTTQANFETYEAFGLAASQIIKTTGGIADLGFSTVLFKGAEMTWSPNVTAGDLFMLNSNYIEVVFDPALWFDMGEWKPDTHSTNRIAHILSAVQMIGTQPRRHGLLYT